MPLNGQRCHLKTKYSAEKYLEVYKEGIGHFNDESMWI